MCPVIESCHPFGIYSILLSIGILFAALGFLGSFAMILIGQVMLFSIFLLLNTSMLVVDSLFLYNFFMLKEKAKLWVNISFAVSFVVVLLIDLVEYFFKGDVKISYFSLIGLPIMWWIVRDYITQKKVDDKLLFSN